MGKTTGFLEFDRKAEHLRSADERLSDYKEVYDPVREEHLVNQAARCMDCGIPFCHSGCPIGNVCPEWNDLVYRVQLAKSWERLTATNNFPEFTGRLCPAMCEEACVLGIHEGPMTIRMVEKNIVEKAYERGIVKPRPPLTRSGKKVAVVGSGPAGLAAADQLNKAGHSVTVYEKDEKPGGLLRYGIPDFKLEKWVIDRRINLMKDEGVSFACGVNPEKDALSEYDAVVMATGSGTPRDLPIPGRNLNGVYFALDFLAGQNRLISANKPGVGAWGKINAKDKHVIVIGGGDTGSDCVGTSLRQGAASVTSFELMPMPPEDRTEDYPWPFWPMKMRTSSSHLEGGDRFWNIMTKQFSGYKGRLRSLTTVSIDWNKPEDGGRPKLVEVPNTEQIWQADLVFLALGFLGPRADDVISRLGLEVDERTNMKTSDKYQTSVPGVFAAGDCHRGQSLVVWAIKEGRECAACVDEWLMKEGRLPRVDGIDLTDVKR
jgi:glutamate synthase (NADPH/NADH) small chain